jgi:hypothetical protein
MNECREEMEETTRARTHKDKCIPSVLISMDTVHDGPKYGGGTHMNATVWPEVKANV